MPDSLILRFHNQLQVFPQEKIYLHTDKPYYISGERIWFRAHLADAATHIPMPVSRYVYVELINPLDSVVTRVKIIHDEAGAYHGHLQIPDDVPEGDYTIRAYTAYMQNLDENYFFTRTVRIGDPQARTVHIDTQFSFEPGRRQDRVYATFRFSHVTSGTPIVPQTVRVSVNNGRLMRVNVDFDGVASINFNLPTAARQRVILLEVEALMLPYRQFIQIPMPDDDFDVSFFPEGGSLMQGALSRVAFKAMKSNGQAANVSGVVYDQYGNEVATFNSQHLGMGSFRLVPQRGKTYHVIVENDSGETKRFELPAALDYGYSLSISRVRDRINISVVKPSETVQNRELYLLAHTRGLVQFVMPWNHESDFVVARADQFPSGVLHFILFDAYMNPISERLMFINNPNDQAQVTYTTDQENYARRSLVQNTVTLTDSEGELLTGSFSVSVTSDRVVIPDSASNILTYLLLTSDLRGHVENPAYYFRGDNSSQLALDLLMLTQGWRRYDIAELAQGRFAQPTIPLEAGQIISGTVQRITLGTPVEDIEVTILSDEHGYFDFTQTNSEGRFYFHGGEFPDSTEFIVHAVRRRGMASMNLIMDEDIFPKRTLFVVPPAEIDRNIFAQHADIAEQMFISEGGIRVHGLSELIIRARRPVRESAFYSSTFADINFTLEEINMHPAGNIIELLARVPGVMVSFSPPSVRVGASTPIFVVDDMVWEFEDVLHGIPASIVAQIDVLGFMSPGFWGGGPTIVIFLKRSEDFANERITFNIDNIMPLGFQQPVEFYAPKYDTPQRRNTPTPDLRTTIHWQPVVQTDNAGVASFEFYTTDDPTSYTVIIEGLTDEGSIIRHEGRIWRRN